MKRQNCAALLQVRAPETLKSALDEAAERQLMSRSDFIRSALLDRLRADGVAVTASAV